MNKSTLHSTGRLYSSFLLLFSLLFFVPTIVSVAFTRGQLSGLKAEPWIFILPTVLTLALGLVLRFITRGGGGETAMQVAIRSGFFMVTTFWILAAGIGCLPFLLGVQGLSFTDAYFEAMSGFTTTGATILPDVESLGFGLGLWRCMAQWLGGMGIIILFVAVLPSFGVSGYNLFRAEIPGGSIVERIKPRIAETAKSLWKIYVFFSVLECFFLWVAGMGLYDAVCHSLTTMPTGGFSTKNQGIAAFHSVWIEWIIILFMLLAGTSFTLHYRILHGENAYSHNTEFKVYLLIAFVSSLVISSILLFQLVPGPSFGDAVRQSIFYVVSIGTTTGFCTVDYTYWPVVAQWALFILMLIGGCTASTGRRHEDPALHGLHQGCGQGVVSDGKPQGDPPH